jgi:hypothetical protein
MLAEEKTLAQTQEKKATATNTLAATKKEIKSKEAALQKAISAEGVCVCVCVYEYVCMCV